jgi:hypothetical protein
MPQVNHKTQGFVFAILAWVIILHLFSLGIPTGRLMFYGILAIFETWALIHKGDGDTISEGFWSIACFPLIPWVCCFFFMHYTYTGVITHPHEIGALVAMQSHFFWQSWTVYKSFLDSAKNGSN